MSHSIRMGNIVTQLQLKKHWRKIREQLWIDRVWDEAHEENIWRPILLANWAAGQAALEEMRRRLTNETQQVRPSEEKG